VESWELHNGELTSAERLSSTKKLSYCGALWVLKMLHSYFQDIDFILFDGLSQDCLTKHFSVGCSKSLLCLQSFSLFISIPPFSTLPPVISMLLILNHQMMTKSPWFAKENVINCSAFWELSTVPSYFKCCSSNSELQNTTFCVDCANLRDLPIVLHIERGYFIFYLHWSYSFDFFFHRIPS